MSSNITTLTIIIPHYNTPVSLGNLLDSIPFYKDIQIVVVDDRSDSDIENFVKIKEKYGSVVEFYSNSAKKGAGTCRNIGLEHAFGKWIMFADADDFFLSDMYAIVSKYFDTDYDLIYFEPTSIDKRTNEIGTRHLKFKNMIEKYINNPSEDNFLEIKTFQMTVPWSKMIRRQLIEKYNVRFSEVMYSNDILFSCKVGHYSEKAFITNEIVYCVTRSENSLTTDMKESTYDIRINEYIKKCNFLMEHYGKRICKRQHITGAGMLFSIIHRKYGWKKFISVYRLFRQNNIPILSLSMFEPAYLVMMLKYKKEEKRFMK